MKRIGKTLVGFIGAVLMLAGAFFVIAGVWDGFGNPAILSRAAWAGGGSALLSLGAYLYYLASDRDAAKAIVGIINGIITGLWP
jgi:hypothetical protein